MDWCEMRISLVESFLPSVYLCQQKGKDQGRLVDLIGSLVLGPENKAKC